MTSASAGCASSGNSVGEFGTMLYRPIINTGDAAEGISLFFTRSTETVISATGSFKGFTAYKGVETGHNVDPNIFQGTSNLTIQPAFIAATTDQIHIKGHINNFFNNTPSCDVDLEASLIPRI